MNDRIINQDDLEYFIENANLNQELKNNLLFKSVEDFFINDDNYFINSFEEFKSNTELKGWIQGADELKLLIGRIYYENKTHSEKLIHHKLLNLLENYIGYDMGFNDITIKKQTKYVEIIYDIEKLFDKKIKGNESVISDAKVEVDNNFEGKEVKTKKKWWQIGKK